MSENTVLRHSTQKIIATALLCCFLSACGAHYGSAEIITEPPGVQVINDKDNNLIGTTPFIHTWKHTTGRNQNIIVKLSKDGYYQKSHAFWLAMRHRNLEDAKSDPKRVEVKLRKIGE